MPKESVRGLSHQPGREILDLDGEETRVSPVIEVSGDITIETPIVDVRWHRDLGFVQVVTRLEECEVNPGDGMPPATYGYYVDLDRDGINALIRKLRRARDQVFGRDE